MLGEVSSQRAHIEETIRAHGPEPDPSKRLLLTAGEHHAINQRLLHQRGRESEANDAVEKRDAKSTMRPGPRPSRTGSLLSWRVSAVIQSDLGATRYTP